ncbi:hypothetical protein LWI29_028460 [Acer saccharum]|uniref:non-specific serine/threonine protein kinase n=1 Tax=Acer saccharum TaxID=4024 RepID=A0AA39T8P3_ACESA|nr:hypothetical protein LWI29_028460 [Acer saccharum]
MRREESSNFLAFLFSLLIFLFVRDVQERNLQQIQCSTSCGDIKNISYPFRLKGDPAGYGDPNFELSCNQSNKTILEFHSGKYYVNNISYYNRIIKVVDVNLANGSCGLPQKSLLSYKISFNHTDYRYYIHDGFTNANFLRCSSKIRYPTYRRLPCLNQSYVYVVYGRNNSMDDLLESCSFISTVPIRNASVDDNPSYETIQKWLQSGFDFKWSVGCKDCQSAGRNSYCDWDQDKCIIEGQILWQSFDSPTSAFLPGMKLGINHKTGQNWSLTSWFSKARKLQQIQCSTSCGDIKNISSPFRLKGDPARCGDPNFELACQSNKTILEFHSGNYYVNNISYDDRIIKVVDVNLADGSCGLPQKSLLSYKISFNHIDYRYYIDDGFTNANFLRCYSKISDPTYTRLPCLNIGNQSYVYVNYDGFDSMDDLLESCSFISTVPIRKASVDDNPSYETIQKLLQSGFDFKWSVGCKDCQSAGRNSYCDCEDLRFALSHANGPPRPLTGRSPTKPSRSTSRGATTRTPRPPVTRSHDLRRLLASSSRRIDINVVIVMSSLMTRTVMIKTKLLIEKNGVPMKKKLVTPQGQTL